MNARDRNAIARESRGKPNPAVSENRIRHAAQTAQRRTAQNRHTVSVEQQSITVTGPGPRRSRVSSISKGQGEWNVSPYYHTHATIDRRWDSTVSTVSGN